MLLFILSEENSETLRTNVWSIRFGQFRLSDLLLGILLIMGIGTKSRFGSLPISENTIQRNFSFNSKKIFFLAFFSILYGVTLGALNGSEELFFAWRSLVYVSVFAFVMIRIFENISFLEMFSKALIYTGPLISLVALLNFVTRGGIAVESLGNVTIFDGPTLTYMCFLSVFSLSILLDKNQFKLHYSKFYLFSGLAVSIIVILLSQRRTYLIILALAMTFTLFSHRKKLSPSKTLLLIFLVPFGVLGSAFSTEQFISRIASINIFDARFQYYYTNYDHVADVTGAWSEFLNSNGLGLGVGVPRYTAYLSYVDYVVGVHNAPLHLLLIFGFLGLFTWFYFLISMIKSYRIINLFTDDSRLGVAKASLIYLLAAVLPEFLFTPWSLGSGQCAPIFAFIFASTILAIREINRPKVSL